MNRSIRTGTIAVAASLVVAAAASTATAQISTGLPTGGSYSPYESFAQRWYDPGAWYGGRSAMSGATSGYGPGMFPGPGGRYADPGSTPGLGFYQQPAMTSPAGEEDQDMTPARRSPPGSSPFFQGYTPYEGWGDRSRDFYDPYFGGDPARAGLQSGAGLPATTPESGLEAAGGPATAAAGLDPPGSAAGIAGATTPAPRPGRAVDVENDDLYEDYDSLYGGYGDYDYVERGSLPNPSYGYGPRYRGYYTDDWYGDSAAFDEWYDSAPGGDGTGDALSPAPGATDAPVTPGEAGAPNPDGTPPPAAAGAGVPSGLDVPGGPATTTPDAPDPASPGVTNPGTTGGGPVATGSGPQS